MPGSPAAAGTNTATVTDRPFVPLTAAVAAIQDAREGRASRLGGAVRWPVAPAEGSVGEGSGP